jgi:hypothetical protein
MAVIGAKQFRVVALLCLALICQAQGNQELRNRLSDITTALSAGNPSNAMEPFDRSFPGYQKLSDYFTALTNAYQVATEVEVTDEEDTDDGIKLTVRWTLHLTDSEKNTENRNADLTMNWKKTKGKWKITNLAPLDLFDPQQPKTGTAN